MVSNHLMRDCRTFVKAMELNQGTKPGSPAYDKRTVNQGDPIQSGQSYPKSSMSQSKKKRSRKTYPDR
jgi:hypothetical protein